MTEKQHKIKNGSFRVKIPTINTSDDNTKLQCTDPRNCNMSKCWSDANIYTVNMLSQNDYAKGWRQVIPKRRTFLKYYN